MMTVSHPTGAGADGMVDRPHRARVTVDGATMGVVSSEPVESEPVSSSEDSIERSTS